MQDWAIPFKNPKSAARSTWFDFIRLFLKRKKSKYENITQTKGKPAAKRASTGARPTPLSERRFREPDKEIFKHKFSHSS